ncbi:hypothetical protein [Microvirga massiliensis]|uniref:hypothetical protein n=1 Tax=Microvirga massiliensis TaxID=1033741 RepID=UPI00062BC871|nr:hypothetical protein [Microvirga massiliensis]
MAHTKTTTIEIASTAVAALQGENLERPGTFEQFEKRFGTVDVPDADGLILWDKLPEGVNSALVWTVVDGDDGRTYLEPGFHRVNRVGNAIAEHPRADAPASYRTYSY